MAFDITRRAHGLSGSRSKDKTSSLTLTFHVKTAAEIFTIGFESYLGLTEDARSFSMIADGTFMVNITYKGFADGDEPESISETEEWGLDFDFSEEPIESNKNFEMIKKTYGGIVTDGKISFPEKLPNAVSSRSGLGGKSHKANAANPLFGHETFPLMKVKASRTYAVRDVPSNLGRNIGAIIRNLPDAPDWISGIEWGSRNWLSMPPKIKQHGDVLKVSETFLLSVSGGWPPEVHAIIEK